MSRIYREAPAMGRDDEELKPSAFEVAKKSGHNLKLVKGEDLAKREEIFSEQTKNQPTDTDANFADDLRWQVQRKISERKNREDDARREAKKLFTQSESEQ